MSKDLNKKILSDLTVHMKYAKYIPELNRRETWEELVTRNKEMHQKRYSNLTDQIQLAYKYVYDKKRFLYLFDWNNVIDLNLNYYLLNNRPLHIEDVTTNAHTFYQTKYFILQLVHCKLNP